MGTTPEQWAGQKFVLRKTFTSDALAAQEGYKVELDAQGEGGYYVREGIRIPRTRTSFWVRVTARTTQRGWIQVHIKIPVIYGGPWKEQLKDEIEKELKTNHDHIGVFLSDIDQQWSRWFEISWEEQS